MVTVLPVLEHLHASLLYAWVGQVGQSVNVCPTYIIPALSSLTLQRSWSASRSTCPIWIDAVQLPICRRHVHFADSRISCCNNMRLHRQFKVTCWVRRCPLPQSVVLPMLPFLRSPDKTFRIRCLVRTSHSLYMLTSAGTNVQLSGWTQRNMYGRLGIDFALFPRGIVSMGRCNSLPEMLAFKKAF